MAYIPVGIIAARDENGNFLPSRPIYIETTGREVLASDMSDMTKKQAADNDAFTEYMIQRFMAYKRAERKAQRKAEQEKKYGKGGVNRDFKDHPRSSGDADFDIYDDSRTGFDCI